MYKIKAPSEGYNRKLAGVTFINGIAKTDNKWLASWLAGRGFEVTNLNEEKNENRLPRPFCDKTYANEETLEKHIKEKHPEEVGE